MIMKNRKKLLAMTLALTLSAAMLASCGGSQSSGSSDSGSSDAAEETLVMATNATFPPYEYVEGNDYEGIDVEIATALAEKLGMTLEIQDVEFDTIVGGVSSGKFDMGMAGMTVTEERKKSVSFTDSYATGIQSVIVPEGGSISSLDDITEDTKIGVQQGTTGDIYACDDFGDDAVTQYKNGADAVQSLKSGKVDCVIIDNEPAKAYVAANEGLTILDTNYAEEDYAICVAKDNTELLTKLNDAVNELKDDGTIDKIIGKYIQAE